ncbi:MAG: lipopolysaccharide kinase InaA family protein [Planctomycetaceae bacterium]
MFPENVMRWGRQPPLQTTAIADRGRRCIRRYHVRHGGRKGIAVSEFSRDCLTHLMDYPDLPIHLNPAQVIKTDATTLLLRTELRLSSGRVDVAYKRIQRRTLIKTVTSVLRPRRLLRSWSIGHHLLTRGVATPRPFAAITAPWFARQADGYLITQWVADAVPADVFLRDLRRRSPRVRQTLLRSAATQLGDLVAKIHAARVTHRDLKAGNVLLREHGQGVEACVIDLEGAAIVFRLTSRKRYKNLARLVVCFRDDADVSLSLRLRFCRAYLEASDVPREHWKSFWTALDRHSERLWRKKQRRRQRHSR